MKILLLIVLSIGSFANTQLFKKDILLQNISEPTLVKVKLDGELYTHTADDYKDIRVRSNQGLEGYFIKLNHYKRIENQKKIMAESYERENAKLIYLFEKPFDVERIELNIEDRNFESFVDIYVNEKLIRSKSKIFDYSAETGNRKFYIQISKIRAKKIEIVYHLDKTTSFYKKYQNFRKISQYLTIKSAVFSNTNRIIKVWDKTKIELIREETKDKQTTYIFNSRGVPFDKIVPNIHQKNFNRRGRVYGSNDAENWYYLNGFTLSVSTLSKQKNEIIRSSGRAKFLKIVIENRDNNPLNIKTLTLYTTAEYLYFLADVNNKYALYFGDKNLEKPLYELEHIVGSDTISIEAKLSDKIELKHEVKELSYLEKNREMLFMVGVLLAVLLMAYIAFGLLKRT